jgi:hypothetical protein
VKSNAFRRIVILSKTDNKVVSDVLGIEDLYEKFCIDETANYLYYKWREEARNKQEFEESMNKHSVKKKKVI